MPRCEFREEHDCDNEGFSQSVDHQNLWFCYNAYKKFIDAKNAVKEFNDAIMTIAIRQPDKLQKAKDTIAQMMGGGK